MRSWKTDTEDLSKRGNNGVLQPCFVKIRHDVPECGHAIMILQ
jgi:hypothetical protein